MKRSLRHFLMAPADQTADLSGMSTDQVHTDKGSELAPPSTETNPEQHGTTGQPGKEAQGTTPNTDVDTPPLSPPDDTPSTEGNGDDNPSGEEGKPAGGENGDDNSGEEQFEEFELTHSEDSVLSVDKFNEIADFIEENKFTKAQAERFLKEVEDSFKLGGDLFEEERKQKSEANRQKLLTDPTFGGTEQGFKDALPTMHKPVLEFGDDGMKELLRSDIGNHPALARFLYNIGKAMESEGFVGSGRETTPKVEKTTEEKFYPDFFKDEKNA